MIAIRGAFYGQSHAHRYRFQNIPTRNCRPILSFLDCVSRFLWRKFLRGSWTRNNPTPPRKAASGMTPPTGALSTTYIDHFSAVKADFALCK